MRKKLIQFVFLLNKESLRNFSIFLNKILPQSLGKGTLKQFHYQYDANNTEYTLFQTSITQFKNLLYIDLSIADNAWFFYSQNKSTYFECIKMNTALHVTWISNESTYTKHRLTIETLLPLMNLDTCVVNTLSNDDANILIQYHYDLFMFSSLSKEQLCNILHKHF